MKKLSTALLAASLPFAVQVRADDFNPDLVSQVYLRTGFAGAAEQTTGLRYGLQYDYSRSAGSLTQYEPVMRMEFLSGQLVALNLGGVNVSPAIDMLRAAGLGSLGNAGALFAAGGAALAYSVVDNNEKKSGFQDLTEEEEKGQEEEEQGGECGGELEPPCVEMGGPSAGTLSVLYEDDTLIYSENMMPVDPAMVRDAK